MLLNVDRYAIYYFLGKALQVIGDRKQSAGWFIAAWKTAQMKERKIEAATEYAGDFLHSRLPSDPPQHLVRFFTIISVAFNRRC